MKLEIKPLSVNQCWAGRRFKTPKYTTYERNLFTMLPKIKIPEPPFELSIEFGFSSIASDIDNPVKPFLDILQKRYLFDDKLIHKLNLTRVNTKKGSEFIKWEIKTLKINVYTNK